MIPLPLLERSLSLMSDDEPIAKMFADMVRAEKNTLVNVGRGLVLDPRIFNAHTFERVAARARVMGDRELGDFMAEFAIERKKFDEEQERVGEALEAGRVISYDAAGELFRALGFETDEQVRGLRIAGYRLALVMGKPAFALVRDSAVSLVA